MILNWNWKYCVITSERLDTNSCQVRSWSFVHVSSSPNIVLWDAQKNIVHKKDCGSITLNATFCKSLKLISSTRFHSWFLKKVCITRQVHVSSPLWCQACTTNFSKEHNKILYQNFQFFYSLNDFIWASCFYWHERTYRKQEFQNILERKLQLLWTVVTYLLKNCFNMILLVLMEFVWVRRSWVLQQIWWIPCNLIIR